jgi:hypothetical protein
MNDFGHTLIFFYKDIYFSVSSKATLVGDASFLKQSAFRMQHPRRGNRVSISLSCLESQSRESLGFDFDYLLWVKMWRLDEAKGHRRRSRKDNLSRILHVAQETIELAQYNKVGMK